MKMVNIFIEIHDDTKTEEVERIVGETLDGSGIDCIYSVSEGGDKDYGLKKKS